MLSILICCPGFSVCFIDVFFLSSFIECELFRILFFLCAHVLNVSILFFWLYLGIICLHDPALVHYICFS